MAMYITILGRQPALGVAELESVFGSSKVSWFSDQSATVDTSSFAIERLGGIQKAGAVVATLPSGDWHRVSMKIVQAYTQAWAAHEGKITLGISAYGFSSTPPRDIQKTGIVLKQKLKKSNVSLRLIPNTDPALSTATSHHSKLGLSDNKVELLVVKARSGKIIIAESTGTQNISAYAKRDQERPKRDAFVGMLPPKLAQIMINLGTQGLTNTPTLRLLDPFCGTGVILQEAALMHYSVYGTDIAEKMVRYTRDNINWLQDSHRVNFDWHLEVGDATTFTWQQPVSTVVCESYLGQPFSAPPSPTKLTEVRGNCDRIISDFLVNIGKQLPSGTPLCVAVPAWRSTNGDFSHLPLVRKLETLGYTQYSFKNVTASELLYYREDQVVARELLVLTRN